MAYDPEYQITWDQLAPSLQAIFQTLQEEMNTLQNNYRIMVNKLTTYTNKVDVNTTNIAINTADIDFLKRYVALLNTDIENIKTILSTIDTSSMIDLIQLRADVTWCIEEIEDIKKLTKFIPTLVDESVSLRTDVDRLEELAQWILPSVNEIVDLRTDVDRLEELNIDTTEHIVDLRIDLDEVWEQIDAIQALSKPEVNNLLMAVAENREDIDKHEELLAELDDLRGLVILSKPQVYDLLDNVAQLRIDLDRDGIIAYEVVDTLADHEKRIDTNTEEILRARVNLDRLTEEVYQLQLMAAHISDNRTYIDINTEAIKVLETQATNLLVEATEARKDIDRNTLLIQKNAEDILREYIELVDNRTDIDKNTELIQDVADEIDTIAEKIKQELIEYINKMRFLNIAPKINFTQEDTVECYPTYQSNNVMKFVATTDIEGNEILYIVANSGAALETYDLYKGYRTSENQEFIFSNIALSPYCFLDSLSKVSTITDIKSATSDSLCVYVSYTNPSDPRNGWYLVETNMDKDPNNWQIAKALGNIVDTKKTVAVRYFADYDTLMTVDLANNYGDLKEAVIANLRIYRYSTLSLLQSYPITNPMQLLTCDTTQCSFDTNRVENRFINGNCGDLGYDIDTPISDIKQGFTITGLYHEESETFALLLKFANIVYMPIAEVGKSAYPSVAQCALKVTYKCPQKVVDGNGVLSDFVLKESVGDIVWDPSDVHSYFYTNNIQASNLLASYDTLRDRAYINWHEFNSYKSYFTKYDTTIQATASWETRGENDPVEIKTDASTPDACPWGKRFYKYIMAWDQLFVNCSSSVYGDCVLWVKDVIPSTTDFTVVIPKAGSYFHIDPIPVFSQFGDSSCKTSSGDPRYFHTEYDSTSNIATVYEYLPQQTTTDFKVTQTQIKTTMLATSNIYYYILNPWFMYANVFYNVNDDVFIMVIQDNTRDPGFQPYSDYAFIAVFDGTNGSLINCYGPGSITNFSSNWTDICSYVQNAKTNSDIIAQVRCMTFVDDYVTANIFYMSASGYYTNQDFKNVYMKFTNGYLDMQMSNGYNFVEKVYTNEMPQGTGLIYAGPTLGLCFQGEKYDPTYQALLTQNALPGGKYGTSNSTLSMIQSGSYNRYKLELKSAIGLIIYIPSIAIFLGGYYSVIENPIPITLESSTVHYIYLERDPITLDILAYASKTKLYNEGARVFSKILIAKVTTDVDSVIDIQYYHINIGYNDYTFHT